MAHWSEGPAAVLHPTPISVFLEEHWDDAPLVIQGRDAEVYSGLLGLDDLDRLISTAGLRHPTFRLVKQGAELPTDAYTVGRLPWGTGSVDGFIDLDRTRHAIQDGATFVMEAMQRLHAPVAKASRLFEQHLHCPAPANLYMTPPSAQGFEPHFDVQNVFVMQLHGTKHWKVYGPHIVRPVARQAHHGAVTPGPLLHEVTLAPGDLLYLPRGFVHCAETTDSLSVHLSMSLLPTTWVDVFAHLGFDMTDEPLYRAAVMLQPGGPADAEGALEERFSQLAQDLCPEADLEDVLDALGRRFVASRLPAMRGQYAALAHADIDAQTALRPHPGMICRVEADGDHALLHFHGKTLSYPWTQLATLRWVVAADTFCTANIPGEMDAAGKLRLASELLDAGFLLRA